jgi:dTDP-4-dehydrorhamnose reductase
MNILVTGANGLLGSHLMRRFDRSNHSVAGLSRNKPAKSEFKSASFIELDMTSSDIFYSFLMKSEFDVIINCAAMADVDLCEREQSMASAINFEAVSCLAEYCEVTGALLIQISTDYVFDGEVGPYNETDSPNPINYYGRSKLAAEKVIRDSECEYIIARSVHVYGNLPDAPSKQLAWLLAARNSGSEIKGATDQFSNPTWAGNLAEAIIELTVSSIRGIIHIGGNDYISRYNFALEAAKVLGIDSGLIKKTTINELNLPANRPLKAGLKIEKMKSLMKTRPMGVKEGINNVQRGVR